MMDMKLITGTGGAIFAAFTVGVLAGVWALAIGALIATIIWSIAVDRSSRQPYGWYRD